MNYSNILDIINLGVLLWSFVLSVGFYIVGNAIILKINSNRMRKVNTPLEEIDTHKAKIQFVTFVDNNFGRGEDDLTNKIKKLTSDDIDLIINHEDNKLIKERSYVIPYIYLEMLIFPENRVIKKLQKIAGRYSRKHIVFEYLHENIFEIFIRVKNILPDSVYREVQKFKYSILFMMVLSSFILLGIINLYI